MIVQFSITVDPQLRNWIAGLPRGFRQWNVHITCNPGWVWRRDRYDDTSILDIRIPDDVNCKEDVLTPGYENLQFLIDNIDNIVVAFKAAELEYYKATGTILFNSTKVRLAFKLDISDELIQWLSEQPNQAFFASSGFMIRRLEHGTFASSSNGITVGPGFQDEFIEDPGLAKIMPDLMMAIAEMSIVAEMSRV